MSIVSLWLASKADEYIKEVEILYTVMGYSFLRPNHVFGALEKELIRKDVVVNPDEVYDTTNKYATLKIDWQDVGVLDFKKVHTELVKQVSNWQFQISKVKRVFIKRKQNICIEHREINYS